MLFGFWPYSAADSGLFSLWARLVLISLLRFVFVMSWCSNLTLSLPIQNSCSRPPITTASASSSFFWQGLCNAVHTRIDAILLLSITQTNLTFVLAPLSLASLHPVCALTALQVLLDQSTKANSPLKGHERTVQYLQRLGKDQLPTGVCLSLECQSCHLR